LHDQALTADRAMLWSNARQTAVVLYDVNRRPDVFVGVITLHQWPEVTVTQLAKVYQQDMA